MTQGELERLAVLEAVVGRIEDKLDDALAQKADCKELELVKSDVAKMQTLIVRVFGGTVVMLVTWTVARVVYIWANHGH